MPLTRLLRCIIIITCQEYILCPTKTDSGNQSNLCHCSKWPKLKSKWQVQPKVFIVPLQHGWDYNLSPAALTKCPKSLNWLNCFLLSVTQSISVAATPSGSASPSSSASTSASACTCSSSDVWWRRRWRIPANGPHDGLADSGQFRTVCLHQDHHFAPPPPSDAQSYECLEEDRRRIHLQSAASHGPFPFHTITLVFAPNDAD